MAAPWTPASFFPQGGRAERIRDRSNVPSAQESHEKTAQEIPLEPRAKTVARSNGEAVEDRRGIRAAAGDDVKAVFVVDDAKAIVAAEAAERIAVRRILSTRNGRVASVEVTAQYGLVQHDVAQVRISRTGAGVPSVERHTAL